MFPDLRNDMSMKPCYESVALSLNELVGALQTCGPNHDGDLESSASLNHELARFVPIIIRFGEAVRRLEVTAKHLRIVSSQPSPPTQSLRLF
jgi:hypothetical protein